MFDLIVESRKLLKRQSMEIPNDVRCYEHIAKIGDFLAPESRFEPVSKKDEDLMFSGESCVVFAQHNDPIAWLYLLPSIFRYVINNLPEGKRALPVTFFHEDLLRLPGAGNLAKTFIGNTVTSYKEVIEKLESDEPYVMATCPEGSNCMFEYDSPVAEFQQFGLIRAAIQTGVPICVLSFKQDKKMSIPVKVPRLTKGNGKLRIPYITRKNTLTAKYEFIDCPISKDDFAVMNKIERMNAVYQVSSLIKRSMIENFEVLND